MTTSSKATYLSAVNYAIENLADAPADVVERLTALRDSLVKRASAERKPTKAQIASAEARDSIPERMEQGTRYSATDIGKLFGESSQWATPKLSALVVAGVLTKTVEKGKSFYSLA